MTDHVEIKVKKIHTSARVPTYAHHDDACADVYACIYEDGGVRNHVSIHPGQTVQIRTGISVAIPTGWMIEFRPRSGLACRELISLSNSPSTIDANYRGELIVTLRNDGGCTYVVMNGDRICQMRPVRVTKAEFAVVDELDETDRGAGAHGSTGR